MQRLTAATSLAGLDIAEEILPEINPRLFMRIMQQGKANNKPVTSSTSGDLTLADLREKQACSVAVPASGSRSGADPDILEPEKGDESSNDFAGLDDALLLGLDDDQLNEVPEPAANDVKPKAAGE